SIRTFPTTAPPASSSSSDGTPGVWRGGSPSEGGGSSDSADFAVSAADPASGSTLRPPSGLASGGAPTRARPGSVGAPRAAGAVVGTDGLAGAWAGSGDSAVAPLITDFVSPAAAAAGLPPAPVNAARERSTSQAVTKARRTVGGVRASGKGSAS